MATSGSTNYTQTRNQIITNAFYHIKTYAPGEDIDASDVSFASDVLNQLTKSWQAQGLHLWSTSEGVLFLQDEVGVYNMSNSASAARATLATDAVITQLSVAALSGATALTCDDTTGILINDIIGIVQDNDVTLWTTVASVPTSTTLTINNALTYDTAIDRNVYSFTARINRPLRILDMRRVSGSPTAESEVPLQPLTKEEYMALPNKMANSTPTCFYYDPQLDNGRLYIWGRPTNPQQYLRFTFERALEDFDNATDNPDFPQEWLESLTWNLAARLCPAFSVSVSESQKVDAMAAQSLEAAKMFDTQLGSLYLLGNRQGRR